MSYGLVPVLPILSCLIPESPPLRVISSMYNCCIINWRAKDPIVDFILSSSSTSSSSSLACPYETMDNANKHQCHNWKHNSLSKGKRFKYCTYSYFWGYKNIRESQFCIKLESNWDEQTLLLFFIENSQLNSLAIIYFFFQMYIYRFSINLNLNSIWFELPWQQSVQWLRHVPTMQVDWVQFPVQARKQMGPTNMQDRHSNGFINIISLHPIGKEKNH